jgi:hypothetical protein
VYPRSQTIHWSALFEWASRSIALGGIRARLTRPSLVDLAEEELLELVVERQDTSTGDTTEDVGTGTLEEGSDTLVLDDLGTSVHHVLVCYSEWSLARRHPTEKPKVSLTVNLLAGSHHHTTTDGVERVAEF